MFGDLAGSIVDELHALDRQQARRSAGARPGAACASWRPPAASSGFPPRSRMRAHWPTGWWNSPARPPSSCRGRAGPAGHRRDPADARIPALVGPYGNSFGRRRSMRDIKVGAHDAGLRQHAGPGRADLPGAVAAQRRQSAHRAAPRQPGAGAARARSRPPWPAASCAPWSRLRRSISASTGPPSISWSRSARPRAPVA